MILTFSIILYKIKMSTYCIVSGRYFYFRFINEGIDTYHKSMLNTISN